MSCLSWKRRQKGNHRRALLLPCISAVLFAGRAIRLPKPARGESPGTSGDEDQSWLLSCSRWGDLGCMELDTLGGGDAIETCDNPAHLLVMLIAVVPGFLLDPGSRPYRPCLSRCLFEEPGGILLSPNIS